MKDKVKKINKSDLLVYIYFATVAACKGIDLTSDSFIYVALYVFSTLLLAVRFFSQKFKLKELLVSLIILIFGFLLLITTKSNSPLFLFVAIISLKGMQLKKVLKLVFFVHLICFLSMIILSSIGVIHNEVIYLYRESVGYDYRFSFGYKHPNLAQMHMLSLVLNYYYVFDKRSKITCVLWGVASYLLYKYTCSRTSFYICELFILYEALLSGSTAIKKALAYIGKNSFILFSLITAILCINYNTPIVKQIDSFLTGRVYYMNSIYNKYEIKPLGQNDFGKDIIDNSYFSIMYRNGYLLYLLILATSTAFNYRYYKKKQYEKLIFVLFLNLMCFTESFYLMPAINFSVLFYANDIFNSEEKSICKQ